jgi:hypothetical protein
LNLISITLETSGALLLQRYSLIISNHVFFFSSSFFPHSLATQIDATIDVGQSTRVQAAETTEALEVASVEVTENIMSQKLLN